MVSRAGALSAQGQRRRSRVLPTGTQRHGPGERACAPPRRARPGPVRRARRQEHADRRGAGGRGAAGMQRTGALARENSKPQHRAHGHTQRAGGERPAGGAGRTLGRRVRRRAGGRPLQRRGHVPPPPRNPRRMEPRLSRGLCRAAAAYPGLCGRYAAPRWTAGVQHLRPLPRGKRRNRALVSPGASRLFVMPLFPAGR